MERQCSGEDAFRDGILPMESFEMIAFADDSEQAINSINDKQSFPKI